MSKKTISFLEAINISTGTRKTIYRANYHFEAPNWSSDGKNIIFNSHGMLYMLTIGQNEPVQSALRAGARR